MKLDPLNGAEPIFVTEGGIILQLGPPDMSIVFDDPGLPELRQKSIAEIAAHTFELNGIKRYWAGCDGKRCVVSGWGDTALNLARPTVG